MIFLFKVIAKRVNMHQILTQYIDATNILMLIFVGHCNSILVLACFINECLERVFRELLEINGLKSNKGQS